MRTAPRVGLGLALIAAIAGCGEARKLPATIDPCLRCHGGDSGNAAPPRSTRSGSETSDPRVGAHQAHLRGGAIRGPMACAECHAMPSAGYDHIYDHIDGDASPAFGALSRARRASPVFTRATGECAGTYCHGAALDAGGTLDAPVWTRVDGTQAACGTCHGNPPPLPHPQVSACDGCHPQTVLPDGTIDVAGGQHVDGTLDVTGGSCGACHPVPPQSGAHRAHYGDTSSPPLASYGDLRIMKDYAPAGGPTYAFGCGHCHPLDADRHGSGEVNLSPAGAPAGSLKARNAAAAAYDPASGTCSGVYCHSNGKQGAVVPLFRGTPAWTSATSLDCAGCHEAPPPPPHLQVSSCNGCHPETVLPDETIDFAGGEHVDGALDVSGGACGACHPVPPQSGAHRAHYGDASSPPLAAYGDLRTFEDYALAGGSGYAFGCGHCHSLDPDRHGRGEVDLSPAGAPAGSLKARNAAAAAYDPASGTCSGVYCHSSGQSSPAFAVIPSWTSGAALGCDGCHGNPPAYPSGGPGTPDANSHVNLADDGFEFGHFLGVPGVWHTTKHGGAGAAPITCQTCHFETTDAANVAPGRFYYLDTTGRYQLEGGDPYRIGSGWAAQLDCTTCHTGEPDAPPQGTGRVLPLRHVNGRRDVVFDPRTTLPAIPGLPAAPNTPTRPYWIARATSSVPWPATATWNGSTVSFDLAGASYDPATKTCSAVGCHLADTPVWGKPYGWGPDGDAAYCNLCHPMD